MQDQGYVAEVVERRINRKLTRDFLGCIDVIALKIGEPPCFIQTTGGTNKWSRKMKVMECDHLPTLLANGRVLVHAWYQKKNGEWTPREEEIGQGDNT